MEAANCTTDAPPWEFDSVLNITSTEPTAEESYIKAMSIVVYRYVYPIVCVLGVCANVLVFVVWSAETSFNANTFLMKCLAVVDTLFLTVRILLDVIISPDNLRVPTWLMIMHEHCRILTVHTTLAVVLARWLVVYKPLAVHRLLSKRCTVVGYMCTVLWSVVVGLPSVLRYTETFPDIGYEGGVQNEMSVSIFVLCTRGVSVALPIIVLVMLNISMACIMCRNKADCSLGQQSNPARAARCQRLVTAVVYVSVTTFLSYPLAFIGNIAGTFYMNQLKQFCGENCDIIIYDFGDVLEVINSSVNIIFYLLFITRFRQLCLYRINQCFCFCLKASQ